MSAAVLLPCCAAGVTLIVSSIAESTMNGEACELLNWGGGILKCVRSPREGATLGTQKSVSCYTR